MNILAIGEVTKTIVNLLEKKLNKPPLATTPGTFRVTALPPDDDRVDSADGVNLFLYWVTENPHYRNKQMPGRSALALNLHYLLTAFAKKSGVAARDDITAQQILGSAMSILHDFPILNRIHDSDFDASDAEQFSDELHHKFEELKITMAPITIDDYSKIWNGFGKAYRVSIAYEVSFVEIIRQTPVESSGLVQKTALTVAPMASPVINSISPARGGPGIPISLSGIGLHSGNSFTTKVAIDNYIIEESELIVCNDEQVRFVLPDISFRQPVVSINVIAGGQESKPVRFTVDPWISLPRPCRAFPGLPVVCDFLSSILPVSVFVNCDGVETNAIIDLQKKQLHFTVPSGLAKNGPRPITARFIIPGEEHLSSSQTLDIIPTIGTVTTTTSISPLETSYTVTGDRLNGNSVILRVGSLKIDVGQNADPHEFTARINRSITDKSFVVIIDGKESFRFPPKLLSVEPSSVKAGDEVSIIGEGLAGSSVKMQLGTLTLPLVANSYGTRIRALIPEMPSGNCNVSVEVNGNATNELTLEILS
jgi:hypothetical protein